MLMTIGEKITFFRKRLNISQEEMAVRLGMTSQGYGKIERDETDVPYSRLELICKTLGTNLQDLAAYGEKSVNNNNNSLIGNIGNNSTYQICSDQMLAQENAHLKEKITSLTTEIGNLASVAPKEIIALMKGSKE